MDVPEAEGLSLRCQEYRSKGSETIDISIYAEHYSTERYPVKLSAEMVAYMESAYQFYTKLLCFDGMYLHASAVEVCGKGYLFSGTSGVGKSTHTRLWKQLFGDAAQVFNDDKPALRCQDGRWFAYGTPWCGKDGINQNKKVPVGGICFLKQGQENRIRHLTSAEALPRLMSQTLRKRLEREQLELLLNHLDLLVQNIPIYELENRPEPEAARLSYETMRRGAEEAGL